MWHTSSKSSGVGMTTFLPGPELRLMLGASARSVDVPFMPLVPDLQCVHDTSAPELSILIQNRSIKQAAVEFL